MTFRSFPGFIIALIFSTTICAEELQINPSHPNQYTVVKGDTLWDISAKFLNHPWQWPELWKNNAQIGNPNLIYPGDTIYFSIVNGKAQLSLTRNEQLYSSLSKANGPCVLKEDDLKHGRTEFLTSEDGKLLPCIREIPIKEAISLIPSSAIAKYLSSPKVVSENELNNSPYVIGFAGEHLLAGMGDRVYVRAIDSSDSFSYTTYRKGDTYTNPETGEILGYEAKYVADMKLEQAGDPATLLITKASGEIRMGDRIMLSPEEDINLNYFPKPPEQKILGSIISVLGGVSQIGQYNVVVIDKGVQDGIQIGHELDIYKRGKLTRDPYTTQKDAAVKLPDEQAGTLMVFRPFERISYALVMKAHHAIHILDKVQTP
ncbi:MAG: LysM peptidoglycan-binding domain-containing protein [Methylococcaceae bacterium]|nr:LysM peptidoglycan-binding domain-containing protein [Methylococcaceae bacterium]